MYNPRMKKPSSPLISKSNHLVEASYRLTLDEQRLVLSVLTLVDTHPDKPAARPDTPIEVTASDINDLLPVSRKKAYELLQEATDRLAERWVVIDYPDPEEPDVVRTKTRWVSAISYLPDRGAVRLYLAPKIIPYLTQLAGTYTSYRLQHVAQMTSVYAIRLYELLMQWQMKGEREVSIEWMKKQFMIPDSYSRIYDLKRYVIQPAVDQINEHSNLWVKYSQRKSGREVVALQFQFGQKENDNKTLAGPQARASAKPKRSGLKSQQGRLDLREPAPGAPAYSSSWEPAPVDALKDRPKGRRSPPAGVIEELKASLKEGKKPAPDD
jgi:plasmid replication initiation protein